MITFLSYVKTILIMLSFCLLLAAKTHAIIKVERYNPEKTYVYVTGELATPEVVQQKHPAVKLFTFIVETDEQGQTMFAFQSLASLRSIMNIDSSLSEDEAIAEIERIRNGGAPSNISKSESSPRSSGSSSYYSDEDKKLVNDYLNGEMGEEAAEVAKTSNLATFSYTASSSTKAQKSKYYVDENGRTVADITEYGMVWLKETSDGTSAWYGIDNSDGTFKIGSKFWVKWLSPKIDREEFEEYYNKLDEEHKNKVDNNNLWIFLTGVTDPDGNEYTNFYGNLNYYIQIGDDWDKDDINVVFISGKKDSVLEVSYVTLECPEGKDEFAKVVMKHFSPYAVYDEKDETKASNVSKSALIKTGESVSEFIFMFWISLLLVAFLNRKMNKNSICS